MHTLSLAEVCFCVGERRVLTLPHAKLQRVAKTLARALKFADSAKCAITSSKINKLWYLWDRGNFPSHLDFSFSILYHVSEITSSGAN